MKLIFGILMFVFYNAGINLAQDSKIRIEIKGFEELTGKLSIGLFNDPDNFPKKSDNNLGMELEITDSTMIHVIDNLEPGEYALAIYHDENGNGKLDSNFLGMPTEDYVFSNYATGSFGPPSFEDAKFILADSLEIKLDLNK
jgi:uncharacterized protein (DUF2141 family)